MTPRPALGSVTVRPKPRRPLIVPMDRAGPRIPLAYNVVVADVMSRDAATVGPRASLFDALVLMRAHDVRGLPVTDRDGHVLGVLSQKDIARQVPVPVNLPEIKGILDVLMIGLFDQPVAFLAHLRTLLEEMTVEEAMTRPPVVVQSNAPVELAMEVMAERDIHRLPVVEAGRLIGIVTPTDLISGAMRSGRIARPHATARS